MKVYISGKITGLTYLEAFENFARVEKYLLKIGVHEVFNPMTEVDQTLLDHNYRLYIETCVSNLKNCDMILLQNNWKESPCCHEELTNAQRFKKHIRYDRPTDYHDIEMMLRREFRPA